MKRYNKIIINEGHKINHPGSYRYDSQSITIEGDSKSLGKEFAKLVKSRTFVDHIEFIGQETESSHNGRYIIKVEGSTVSLRK